MKTKTQIRKEIDQLGQIVLDQNRPVKARQMARKSVERLMAALVDAPDELPEDVKRERQFSNILASLG